MGSTVRGWYGEETTSRSGWKEGAVFKDYKNTQKGEECLIQDAQKGSRKFFVIFLASYNGKKIVWRVRIWTEKIKRQMDDRKNHWRENSS